MIIKTETIRKPKDKNNPEAEKQKQSGRRKQKQSGSRKTKTIRKTKNKNNPEDEKQKQSGRRNAETILNPDNKKAGRPVRQDRSAGFLFSGRILIVASLSGLL